MKDPLVIGAIGGSGTRVIARIVRHAGVFIGTNLNVSEDSLDFVEFHDRWINRFFSATQEPLSESEVSQIKEDFFSCVKKHLAQISDNEADWGWKAPRSIYLLPFFHSIYPNMKFIHVIRDGRDMAFSENKNQLLKHGEVVLGREFLTLPEPVKAAALWNKVNMVAADYGEKYLKGYYLHILFEDICLDPKITIERICGFLGRKGITNIDKILSEINVPASIGRWKNRDPSLIASIQAQAGEALKRFNYLKT